MKDLYKTIAERNEELLRNRKIEIDHANTREAVSTALQLTSTEEKLALQTSLQHVRRGGPRCVMVERSCIDPRSDL